MKARNPDTTGDVIHELAIPPTVPHETFAKPLEIITNPIMAPTIE